MPLGPLVRGAFFLRQPELNKRATWERPTAFSVVYS